MFNHLLDKSPVSSPVVPVVDVGLGNSAYVVDLGDGSALVVDPERDPRPYMRELEQRHLKARFVVETHLHADFVSGAREFAASGADLCAPAGSELSYPYRRLHDGDELELGGLALRVIATPGHTPEHLAYLLMDGTAPVALFSGGTLTAGGVARTDLLSPDRTMPLARAAYRSITESIFKLPDDLIVYPTHGGGSFCSVGSHTDRTTTVGRERASNPLLAGDPDEDTFVARLVAGYGTYPPYFLELREVNRQGVEVHGKTPPGLPRLTAAETKVARADGAQLVDVRSMRAFADAHVPGSISNPWRPQFSTWLGWLLPLPTPVVFVADETIDRDDLVWAALTVGFERLVGELDGGIPTWREAGGEIGRIPLVDSNPESRLVLDVRQTSEHRAGHLTDAVHTELGDLVVSTGGIPKQPLLVHCGHGERAMTAASLLTRADHQDVAVFAGSPERLGPLVADHSG